MIIPPTEPILIRQYRDFFIGELANLYDVMEAANFFHLALEHHRGLKRSDLALRPDLLFSEEEVSTMNQLLTGLKLEQPIQYLLGQTHFYGLDLFVGADVLIPRPETEELVDWIIGDHANSAGLQILDIGTGSGCIAISIAKSLHATVSAMDVSEGALAIATKNAVHNHVEVQFLLQDILSTTTFSKQYDIIVSNPPYVRHLEKHEIKNNVLEHEPHLALFVDDADPLLFYRKIGSLAIEGLPIGGKLYFEINQYLGAQTIELLQQIGFNDVQLKQDIYGNDRMIRATK